MHRQHAAAGGPLFGWFGAPSADLWARCGSDSSFLGHMRHFAAVRGGTYVLRFPEFPGTSASKSPPRWVQFQVDNFRDTGDAVMLGVDFDGGTTPRRVFAATNPDYPDFTSASPNARLLSAAANRDEVAAGAGNLYRQDRVNHLVWIKVVPLGLPGPWASVLSGSDADLYRTYRVRIEP